MDCSKASEMGAMIGMPVTTIDASACVFTNYNGIGKRGESGEFMKQSIYGMLTDADYHVLKPEGGIRRIPLWEM